MAQSETILQETGHEDLLTALSYNAAATYLASASLDHSIRITQPQRPLDDPAELIRAHDSPVLCLAWADITFGSVLASGAGDGTIKIWTEEEGVSTPANRFGVAATALEAAKRSKKWTAKVCLTESRGTIRAVEFSPSDFGLKLAAISSDSHLRVWECLDANTLHDWNLIEDIDLHILPISISSSTNFAGAPLPSSSSSTGSYGNSATYSGPVKGFETGAASPNRPNISAGSGATLGSTGGSTGSNAGTTGEARKGTVESDGGWSLSWCKEAWWGERLAVSSGTNGIIRLFHLPPRAPWTNYLNLLPSRSTALTPITASPVCSLAWSPSSGRSYQLIASGSRDGRARVWKVVTPELSDEDGVVSEHGPWKGELDSELADELLRGATTTRSTGNIEVEWNVTGTVVSTAGDDAKVRLWKSTYTGQWRVIAVLGTDDSGDGLHE